MISSPCISFLLSTGLVLACVICGEQKEEQETASRAEQLTNAETTELLDQLVANMDYRVRPDVDGSATQIHVSIYVISFGSINDADMDYSMDIYLRQAWYDRRLAYSNSSQSLSISARLIPLMWTPDLFFPTEKKAVLHDITVPNKLMRVNPDGTVVYSMRLTVTLACPMDLSHFPMDRQECDFIIESYANTENELQLRWAIDKENTAVEIADDIELPQFDLLDASTMTCSARKYLTGYYPCVKAKFTLERQYGFFLLQNYIPSMLIVIISWISFWINMDAVPARISLGVTTVLAMATQLSGSKTSEPRISYPKALDIWMVTCMLFVFAALIQYAFVNSLSRKEKRRRAQCSKCCTKEERDEREALRGKGRDAHIRRQNVTKRQTAHTLDKTSRILFPIIFIIFNLAYWPYFTYPQKQNT